MSKPKYLLRAEEELGLLSSLLTQRTSPFNPSETDENGQLRHVHHGTGKGYDAARQALVVGLGSLDPRHVARALIHQAIETEHQMRIGRDQVRRAVNLVFVQLDDGTNVVCGVLAHVAYLQLPLGLPVQFPTDIVAFGLAGLADNGSRLRFLTELAVSYRTAIPLAGEGVRFTREFVACLVLLDTLLRDVVRDERQKQRNHESDPALNTHAPDSLTAPAG